MDLTPYLSSLRQDLATAASAGDEESRRQAQALAAAIEPAARLALMNALSDMAAEITSKLAGNTVEVRLDGRDVKVVVTGHESEAEPEPEPGPQPFPSADATGDISRVTVRMMEELKAKAEQAAASQGLSLNSFVSQALQGALSGNRARTPGASSGAGMRGWTQW
ncbi:toxin-antitoxin system HicB family antitoxin [Sciscionella sediminilitoris]|uniref:toxin-antitoxin system HicB family antitoxin n=1 Tax=Sciscionella sediminilitoris TaxID=1445613 RepID=UPI0004DF0E15|nr:toxin-antitoxin system HicB family antitoxin [Sciscionella sp. SE31]